MPETIHDRDLRINELEGRIDTLTSGATCPICKTGKLSVSASHAHPIFGDFGVQERTLKCDTYSHIEKRLYDPDGVTKKR